MRRREALSFGHTPPYSGEGCRETAVVSTVHAAPIRNHAERRRLARERLIRLSHLMDAAIEVPVLRTRVGLDAVLGLVPVAGDLVSAGIGLFLVAQARELGASRWLQARMIGNLLADAALGAVPLAGDIADVYFRAHLRNLKLLQKELGEPYLDVADARRRR
jgi:hypothetical protein